MFNHLSRNSVRQYRLTEQLIRLLPSTRLWRIVSIEVVEGLMLRPDVSVIWMYQVQICLKGEWRSSASQ